MRSDEVSPVGMQSRVTLLEGRPTTQSGVDPPLVVIGGKSIQLPTQVEAVVEEGMIEILAPQKPKDRTGYTKPLSD